MSWKIKAILVAASCLTAAPVLAADAAPPSHYPSFPDIQLDSIGGVKSWKTGADDLIFIQSKTDQWYRAELSAACMKYDTSKGVNFVTELDPSNQVKISKVVVERRICRIVTMTRVNSPDAK